MDTRQEIIEHFYASCKSFIGVFEKVNIDITLANSKDLENCNIELLHNFKLLESLVNRFKFKKFFLKKHHLKSRSYFDIQKIIEDTILDQIELGTKAKYSDTNFLEQYLKYKKSIISNLGLIKNDDLIKYGIVHQKFGPVSILELVYITIALNYYSIDRY